MLAFALRTISIPRLWSWGPEIRKEELTGLVHERVCITSNSSTISLQWVDVRHRSILWLAGLAGS